MTPSSPEDPHPPTRRPRIGLLVDCLRENYENTIWAAAVDEARALDANLICFAGGLIPTPRLDMTNRAVLHSLIGPRNIDGLVSLSGSIGNYVSPLEIQEHYRRHFGRLPLISIGSRLDTYASITVDNEDGMYRLVSHFIEHHGRKKIAFIGGPPDSHDAHERIEAYRRALVDHGLIFEEQLVAHGDFIAESGGDAVIELVKKRRVSFDALIAANDYMAIDAMRVLEQFGMRVGKDVLIGGFDDIAEAREAEPALTTVGQPLQELGREGIRQMAAWLRNDAPPPPSITVKTRLILRGSCGCHGASAELRLVQSGDAPHLLSEFRLLLEEELTRHFPAVSLALADVVWAREIIDAYIDELQGMPASFMPVFRRLLATSERHGTDVATWGNLLSALFQSLSHYFPDSLGTNLAAMRLLAEYAEAGSEERRTVTREHSIQLFQRSLAASFNRQRFIESLRKAMPRLGISTFYFSQYTDPVRTAAGPAHAMVLFNYLPATRQVESGLRDNETPLFPSDELVPGGLHDGEAPYSMTVYPVFIETEDLGFAVFDNENSSPITYEILADQLSTLIKGSRLIEEARNHALRLEQDVIERTRELRTANDALQRNNREIQKLNEELDRKSKVDALTGLYNRGAFFEILRIELARTRRALARAPGSGHRTSDVPRPTFSVMMIDLDHFKRINDNHGHIAGDRVLVAVGELLRDPGVLRLEDAAGRFGGEEFIVLLSNTGAEHAVLPAQRILTRLKSLSFEDATGGSFFVTLSAGLSQYDETDSDEEAVIHRADQALYHAKHQGRDQIVVYEKMVGDGERKLLEQSQPPARR